MKRILLAVAALALAACERSSADGPIPEQWRAVAVESIPIELGAERVGRLVFRGGLDLRSDDEDFGGLSGLEVLDDGSRMVAVSDSGHWFEARLLLDETGRLVGLGDMRTALLRDERGRPFPDKESGDSEGLTQLPDGRFAVSFEQTQGIRIYDLNRDGPFGPSLRGPRLDEVRRLPANVGLEALATFENGDLLVGAEGGDEPTTPLWRAPLESRRAIAPRYAYPLADGFSLTGLDRLPDGGFVAIERFYAPVIGARARITRFAAPSAEGVVQTEELALIGPPLTVDNFEGIAAVLLSDGRTRLYIASDDNFSDRQRTLLLAFDVVG